MRTTLAVAFVLASACSSKNTADIPSDASDSTSLPAPSSDLPPLPPPPPPSSLPNGSGPSDAGAADAAGSIPVFDAGPCVSETEPNDTADVANAAGNATFAMCGSVSSASDVDYFSFTLPADATYLAFVESFAQAGVTMEATVGSKTFDVGTAPVFVAGGTYVVKVHSTGGTPVKYELDVEIRK